MRKPLRRDSVDFPYNIEPHLEQHRYGWGSIVYRTYDLSRCIRTAQSCYPPYGKLGFVGGVTERAN